ncbi:V-type proton ATPase subunit S1 [Melopsittacus undulatus]|uniref:V-type proton ATPase subunit S1 n=1 Tax=Melopsittacus undulatus TaxID=13146 RepID=UPI00146E9FD0|nr:V-type proton ATPase subunit S1 [Melopsittacus undulatus]
MAAALEAALRARVWLWAWAVGLSLGPGPVRTAQVPLLAWSTHRALWPPPGAGGRVVTEAALRELLSPALERGPRTVLLVLQDKLSIEDFTAYGGVYGNKPDSAFPNLEGALGAAGSALVLPAVAGGAVGALPHTLSQALGAAPLRVDGAALRLLRLNTSLPALLLLRLPHTAGSSFMAPKEVLTSNDEMLGQVLSVLKEEDVPYTALFTALQPSHVPPVAGGAPLQPHGRALLGAGPEEEQGAGRVLAPPPAPLRWPEGGPARILLWARNLSVTYRGQLQDLSSRTFGGGVELGGSSWEPEHARLVLKYDDVFGGTLNITFVLRRSWFPVSGRSWAWLAEVWLSLVGGGPPVRFMGRGGAAPTPLGWRCGELGAPGPFLLPPDPPGPASDWSLRLLDVQVQAFNVSGGVFGGASDCAAFFTPGTWMGLVTGALLLGGLCYGGALLLHLRPMDRFDDPRGPPLPVPSME